MTLRRKLGPKRVNAGIEIEGVWVALVTTFTVLLPMEISSKVWRQCHLSTSWFDMLKHSFRSGAWQGDHNSLYVVQVYQSFHGMDETKWYTLHSMIPCTIIQTVCIHCTYVEPRGRAGATAQAMAWPVFPWKYNSLCITETSTAGFDYNIR